MPDVPGSLQSTTIVSMLVSLRIKETALLARVPFALPSANGRTTLVSHETPDAKCFERRAQVGSTRGGARKFCGYVYAS